MIATIGWYFLWIVLFNPEHPDIMGPYPTKAVCEAARKGATEFAGGVSEPELCSNDPKEREAQIQQAVEKYKEELRLGGGMR